MNKAARTQYRQFQFGLGTMLAALVFVSAGMTFLLGSTGPFPHFAGMTSLAGASFGTAAGIMLNRTYRFAAYGLALGFFFALYAAAV
jgi:hypothetical protein